MKKPREVSEGAPRLGEPLPDFSLPATDFRSNKRIISPASLRGTPFVLFAYPRDSTPGCTVESCNFRDLYLDFQAIGVEVFGISRDGLKSHQSFIKKSELPYSLIADEKHEVIGGWGLMYDAKMYGKPVTKVARTTYFVDAEGIVRQIWEEVTPLDHGAQVLEFVSEFLGKDAATTA